MGMTDKQAIADAYALGYAEGFANADDIFDLNEDDMEEHGWVRAERLKYREIAKENEERLLEDTLRRTISDLKDEINWLHSELHGAEMEAKKVAELKAENVRLRSCLEDAAENERLTTHEFNQLKEERDRLRGMLGCPLLEVGKRARQNGKRLPCERLMERNTELRELLQYVADNHLCGVWLEERMRELGVKV